MLDSASPELKRIRNELRQKRQKLRGTLEQYARGASSKYPAGRGHHRAQRALRADGARRASRQRARHRARLVDDRARRCFMEPAATVEINNDIVELEDREREEIFRILLELTDRVPRARRRTWRVSREVARAARRAAGQGALQLEGQRHRAGVHDRHEPAAEGGAASDARARGAGRRAARSAEPRAADHRSKHRRQDRGAEDRGAVRR